MLLSYIGFLSWSWVIRSYRTRLTQIYDLAQFIQEALTLYYHSENTSKMCYKVFQLIWIDFKVVTVELFSLYPSILRKSLFFGI